MASPILSRSLRRPRISHCPSPLHLCLENPLHLPSHTLRVSKPLHSRNFQFPGNWRLILPNPYIFIPYIFIPSQYRKLLIMLIPNASSLLSSVLVSAHAVTPYNNTGSATALKTLILTLRLTSLHPQRLALGISIALVAADLFHY